MTNQEASEILKQLLNINVRTEGNKQTTTALEMAIKALERQDADGCKDCKYEEYNALDNPCEGCMRNHKDYWTRKKENSGETADKLVHCKDCKSAQMTYDGECKYCDQWTDSDGNYLKLYVPGDFYCGFGVKKDGD